MSDKRGTDTKEYRKVETIHKWRTKAPIVSQDQKGINKDNLQSAGNSNICSKGLKRDRVSIYVHQTGMNAINNSSLLTLPAKRQAGYFFIAGK